MASAAAGIPAWLGVLAAVGALGCSCSRWDRAVPELLRDKRAGQGRAVVLLLPGGAEGQFAGLKAFLLLSLCWLAGRRVDS